ncbi:MAG: hypothetical protein U0414_40085 [Polyangiaceae bacterium]
MSRCLVPLALALVASTLTFACGRPAPVPSSSTARATGVSPPTTSASEGEIPRALLAKVCSAEDTDARSEVFVAYKGKAIHRLVVTPSRNIPDMGNLIFDSDGVLLGHDTGMEFPREEKALYAEERARVGALMDGAATGSTGIPCK